MFINEMLIETPKSGAYAVKGGYADFI